MEPDLPPEQTSSSPQKPILNLLISIILILTGTTFYLSYQNWKIKTNTNTNIEMDTTPIETDWSISPETSQSIQEITNQILSDTIELTSNKDGVPTFTKEFDLSQTNGWANYVITVHKYIPGTKIEEGYEGFRWIRNLDTEIKELNNIFKLENGTYVRKPIIQESIETSQTYTNISIKEIGDLKYAIEDTYFPPSNSWHRKYQTYDQNTNNIIEISMGISPKNTTIEQKNICYEDKCAQFFFYPEEINYFFMEQESLMKK